MFLTLYKYKWRHVLHELESAGPGLSTYNLHAMSMPQNPKDGQSGYKPDYTTLPQAPGFPQPYVYAPPSEPPPAPAYSAESKSPYEGDRFKPRRRINDPAFLIFFILQVSTRNGSAFPVNDVQLSISVRWVYSLIGHRTMVLGVIAWLGRRSGRHYQLWHQCDVG
jgi:hypothetical protein